VDGFAVLIWQPFSGDCRLLRCRWRRPVRDSSRGSNGL